MNVDAMSLPVFETAYGELADGVPDVLPDLRYGFVLQECAAIGGVDDIHSRHVAGGVALLSTVRPGVDWRIVPEFDREVQKDTFGRHFDGLAARYYQAHTTHASDGGTSHMGLEWHDLTLAEHQGTRWRWRSGIGLSGAAVVDMRLLTRPFLDYPPAISADRVPQGRTSVDGSYDQTIIFPNGYDATERSMPGRLFVHNFLPIAHRETGDETRVLSLTRIELVA